MTENDADMHDWIQTLAEFGHTKLQKGDLPDVLDAVALALYERKAIADEAYHIITRARVVLGAQDSMDAGAGLKEMGRVRCTLDARGELHATVTICAGMQLAKAVQVMAHEVGHLLYHWATGDMGRATPLHEACCDAVAMLAVSHMAAHRLEYQLPGQGVLDAMDVDATCACGEALRGPGVSIGAVTAMLTETMGMACEGDIKTLLACAARWG